MGPTPADSPPPQHGATSTLTVAAQPSALRTLRSHVGDFLRSADAPGSVVDAFELAASELATNVIQHTAATQVTVTAERAPEGWTLVVSDADQIAALPAPMAPDPDQLTGRGLVIVQAMMDEVIVVDVDGHQHIRCLKRA